MDLSRYYQHSYTLPITSNYFTVCTKTSNTFFHVS